MADLSHLADEICAGAEIYYSGKAGGQYIKTAFLLCDDYTELAAKLFLVTDNPGWPDQHANGHFKNYHTVLDEATARAQAVFGADATGLPDTHDRMKQRRRRRNDFFHSTSLLDLNVTARMSLEGFCDLFNQCQILFPEDWPHAAAGARNLETLMTLFELDRLALSDPSIQPQLNEIIERWPRSQASGRRLGVQIAVFPEDLHLRLCIISGGTELRDRLRTLLEQATL